MLKQRQLDFEILEDKNIKHFGGAFLKNSNPKEKRPITTKRAMHLVLRSSRAKGSLSFLKKERIIQNIIYKQAKSSGVKVYRVANGGNHLHLIIMPSSREAFNTFIRSVSGLIVREILGVQRGRATMDAKEKGKINVASGVKYQSKQAEAEQEESVKSVNDKLRFWDKRPFTRIVEWGREYKTLYSYLDQNSLEAYGFIPHKPRKYSLRATKSIHSTA